MRSLTTGNSATRERRQRAHRARTAMEDTGESTGSIRLARRDQRSLIPHHAHAPAPSPSRRWSIRCVALALVTDGNLGTPLAPRFRLRFGFAPLHCGLRCAMRSAPPLVPLLLADLQTEAPLDDRRDDRRPKRSNAVTLESHDHCMAKRLFSPAILCCGTCKTGTKLRFRSRAEIDMSSDASDGIAIAAID